MKVLIVEDQEDLRSVMRMTIESAFGATVLEAASGNQGAALVDSDPEIGVVLCDYEMPEGYGSVVFAATQSKSPPVPYILCTSRDPEECQGITPSLMAGYLQKPFTLSTLKKALSPWFKTAPSQKSTAEPPYFPVRLQAVPRNTPLVADLYIRLGDTNFVRLLNKGDLFSETAEKRYSEKKVERFYYHSRDRDLILDSLLALAFQTLKQSPPQIQEAFEISEALHEAGKQLIDRLGIESRSQQLIATAVQLAISIIDRNSDLKRLLKDVYILPESFAAAHSVLLGYVTGALACSLEWGTDENLKKLAIASFLHDIPIQNPALIEVRALKELARFPNLTSTDRENFEQHPYAAAQLARQLEDMPLDVDTILEQHHEHPSGDGFPERLPSDRIHPYACIFVVAEDLVTRRIKDDKTDINHHLTRMLGDYPQGFCRKLIENSLAQIQKGKS